MPDRPEFGIVGHAFAGGVADLSTNWPFYHRIHWEAEKNFALEAEALGFESIWLPDHPSVGPGGTALECWTTVTTYLNVTKRLRAGPFALSNNFRHPSLIAKMASTLDVISGGRLNLTLGAGWNEDEYSQYGLPFPKFGVRVEQLREGIQIMKMLWTGEPSTFAGRYYSIKDAVCAPVPVQRPHPPIIIGGGSDRILRLTAEMADGWNWYFGADQYREKLAALERFCSELGRDYKSIRKSWGGHVIIGRDEAEVNRIKHGWYEALRTQRTKVDPWVKVMTSFEDIEKQDIIGTPEECIEKVELYREAGVETFMPWFIDFPSLEGMRLFAREVLPAFR